MNKCDCSFEVTDKTPLHDLFTGEAYHYAMKKIGRCNGTREQDICSCNGNREKCSFYPEVREKALNNNSYLTLIKCLRCKVGDDCSIENCKYWDDIHGECRDFDIYIDAANVIEKLTSK